MKTAFNIPPAEHDALVALLRESERQAHYVQVKFNKGYGVALMRSGRLKVMRPGVLRDTTTIYDNIDTWLASLNA